MKYTHIRAFEKHLEGASPQHFADIYLLISKDSFERKTAADRLLALVLKGQAAPSMSVQSFEAGRHSIQDIMNELNAMAFFSSKRVVIVQDAENLDKPATSKLEEYFEKPNSSVCLVISASAINHSTNFYKKAEKAGVVFEAAEEKPWEREKTMLAWVSSEASSEGKRIDSAACHFLIKQLGTNQATLHNELQKLFCYVGSRPEITMQDIGAVTGSVNLDNAWQLGEAIFRREAGTALRITKALLNDGTQFLALLRQIRTQFQTEFQVCSILANGGTPSDVSQQFPYMRGTILDRHIQMSQSYGMHRFRKGLMAIDETEVNAKNSQTDSDLLAELLIVKLTM